MNKILITVLYLCIMLGLSADEFEKMDKMLTNRTFSNQTELALNLGARGSFYHSQEKYNEALDFYQKSLKIRKNLGMDHSNGYANILFLSAIAAHKLGDSCTAAKKTIEVIEIHKYLGNTEDADEAEKKGWKVFQKSCNQRLASN